MNYYEWMRKLSLAEAACTVKQSSYSSMDVCGKKGRSFTNCWKPPEFRDLPLTAPARWPLATLCKRHSSACTLWAELPASVREEVMAMPGAGGAAEGLCFSRGTRGRHLERIDTCLSSQLMGYYMPISLHTRFKCVLQKEYKYCQLSPGGIFLAFPTITWEMLFSFPFYWWRNRL